MRKRKILPYEFVVDLLGEKLTAVKSMFGCEALYSGSKIVLIMRKKDTHTDSNGIWLATSHEHHESLRKIFPNMTDLTLFGSPPTNWQVLQETSPDFEAAVERACELIVNNDPRIGKIPKQRKSTAPPKNRKPKQRNKK
ncbi:MAG: hypothetical protein IT289_08575 [Oligoflexia bacterium]|nr:hypothetical protein [Oligoflexia bacterium]